VLASEIMFYLKKKTVFKFLFQKDEENSVIKVNTLSKLNIEYNNYYNYL
jgi:hypothetical protein